MMEKIKKTAKEILLYKLLRKRDAFRNIFHSNSEDAEIVLKDLARFCYANKPAAIVSPISGSIDPLAMAYANGRREVWLHIQKRLNLSQAQITKITKELEENE